jgi:hypothetical protein
MGDSETGNLGDNKTMNSNDNMKEVNAMFRYTFRVDTPFGYEIADAVADSIAEAQAELAKRSPRGATFTLLGSFDLKPQVFLAF